MLSKEEVSQQTRWNNENNSFKNNRWADSNGTSFITVGSQEIAPSARTTHGTVDEINGFLRDLELELYRLQSSLAFPVPSNPEEKKDRPASIDGKLNDICTRAANLCGFIRTVNNQLGSA